MAKVVSNPKELAEAFQALSKVDDMADVEFKQFGEGLFAVTSVLMTPETPIGLLEDTGWVKNTEESDNEYEVWGLLVER